MRTRRLVWTAALLMLAGTAAAGTFSDANYALYWLNSPSGALRVAAGGALPPGSNVPPNNQWRYDYSVVNKSPNALSTFYSYFNSDNLTSAGHVSATSPVNWTILKQGPIAPNNNYKMRFRTTLTGSMIPQMGSLLCSVTFTWTGSGLPGPQNYDAVTSGGSEAGVTVDLGVTPTLETTWGRLKTLYR